MPPRWSLGAWLSRAYYRTADELLDVAQEVVDRDLPIDVITLDGRAWQDTDTRFAFEWDPVRYPKPEGVIAALMDKGLRLCVWEYPLVSVRNRLFDEMAAKGWLLKDRHGEPSIYRFDPEPFGQVLTPLPDSGLVDFTHPDAFAFWRDRHLPLFNQGVAVFKSDFGEQVPDDAIAHNGDTGRRLHNVYPLLYNRCVFEAARIATARQTATDTPDRPLVFGRSGWIGSQRYPVQWGGDPQTDWEGLAGSIRGGLSWGLSGAPCYATDIGGFYGAPPDAELFVRWTQAAVFASHMRFHGVGPREPWAFGDDALAIVRDFLALRYRLIPYLEQTLAEAEQTGLPVMRAMPVAFPAERTLAGLDGQYMFGPDLLVAPVVRPGGHVTVVLPPGDWVDFWDGTKLLGNRRLSLTCPLDRIPVYVRAGATLPLGPADPPRRAAEVTATDHMHFG